MTFVEKMEELAYKVGKQKHLLAIRDGMVLSMPLILIGSIFVIIQSFPVPAWESYLTSVGAMGYLGTVINATFGIMALVAVFGIAKKLADIYKTDGTSAGIIALAAYLMLIPSSEGMISFGYFGSRGLFVAIVVGLLTGEIFRILIQRNIVIKMPESVPQQLRVHLPLSSQVLLSFCFSLD